jgi:hypothetical protein
VNIRPWALAFLSQSLRLSDEPLEVAPTITRRDLTKSTGLTSQRVNLPQSNTQNSSLSSAAK